MNTPQPQTTVKVTTPATRSRRMVNRRILAVNVKQGDVLDGQRIIAIHKTTRRNRSIKTKVNHILSYVNVLFVVNNRNGYRHDIIRKIGSEFVKVKRPQYNLRKK